MEVTDDYINKLFQGTNFGESTNNSVKLKRELLAKTLRHQIEGYWSGSTVYHIAVYGGFLIDAKSGKDKKLTQLGKDCLTAPTN